MFGVFRCSHQAAMTLCLASIYKISFGFNSIAVKMIKHLPAVRKFSSEGVIFHAP
jgi:hypothetical protein